MLLTLFGVGRANPWLVVPALTVLFIWDFVRLRRSRTAKLVTVSCTLEVLEVGVSASSGLWASVRLYTPTGVEDHTIDLYPGSSKLVVGSSHPALRYSDGRITINITRGRFGFKSVAGVLR
jgi:hypothetical protein